MTLLDLFAGSVRDRRDHTALVMDGRRLSYGALEERSRRVAAWLSAQGHAPGDRLAIYLENQLAFVDAYLGALRAGLVVVPTNPLYRDRDAVVVWEDAEVRGIVSAGALAAEARKTGFGERVIEAAEIERVAEEYPVPAAWREFDARPETVALIIFTSGTTGRAKGAMIPHRALAASAAAVRTAWRWRPDDVLCIALPLFHVHGLQVALGTTLVNGSTIVVERRFDAESMLELLERERATMFFGVPTMYVRLLERLGERRPPALRLWVSGSAALSAEVWGLFRERFGQEILERYGATETMMCLTNRYGGPRIPGAVGLPFPGVEACIVDQISGARLADGEVGELCIWGPNVFSGYFRNPQATAAAFLTDDGGRRWFRSGDLARLDPQSRSYAIVGRLKEMIISGGFNVYPREIEEEIDAFPGVKESAVVPLREAARGEVPLAFVAPLPGVRVDVEALLTHLRERIASFKVPREVRFLESLPRNAMGKLDKPTLRRMIEGS
ncbi:long-chain fatty acid--CoA ligase [bacterium]|nr:MAG: long-chain fatty acid--CoA ligase [bacterium]